MKKFLAIIVLGLFWCNAGLAKDIYLSCKGGNSFIINDKTKKIIMDGVEREVVEWKKEFITFHENEISKQVTEITGSLPILDRITGYFSQKTKCTVVDGTKF